MQNSSLVWALIACWSSLARLAACSPVTSDVPSKWLTVNTKNGPITGHLANSSESVIEYLGIPYAQPPVDDLRFAPPWEFSGHGPYIASDWGFDCPLTPNKPVDYPDMTPQAHRIIAYFAAAAGKPQSEDCLTLNIWSKPTAKSDDKDKPVVVFFYGGRFTTGSTDSPFYNGQYFAEAEDIIVVTVNYRINIFGFPGIPNQPQNLGIRDQRLAVEWVRDNIASFGGSPRKIILMGQSAGGVSVDYHSYAYARDPIASGFILHSGDAFSFPVNEPTVPARNWYNVSGQLGCGTSGDVLSCMKMQSWEDIKTAAAKVKPAPSSSVLRSIPAFYPTPDGQIIFSDYVSLTEAGEFAKLPVLLGNADREDGYYRVTAYANGIVPTADQIRQFLLESFTCPNSYQAHYRRAQHVPTWQYRYFGDWDNIRLYPDSGAYHGSDMEMLFGASEDVSGIAPSSNEEAVTALMQKAWAAFANDPARGLSMVMQWPKFGSDEKSLIRLAYHNAQTVDFVDPISYDGPCSTITLGALATGT